MADLLLYGAGYSIYTRIVRLVLEELGLGYELIETDIFTREAWPAGYASRQPFGKIPALEHKGFRLYESDAIASYLIEQFGGERLLPREPKARARMRQVMRISDNYVYGDLVWGLYVAERESGEAASAEALAKAKRDLEVLEGLAEEILNAAAPSPADLWLAPMLALTELSPSGRDLLSQCRGLTLWLEEMAARPSMAATRGPAGR